MRVTSHWIGNGHASADQLPRPLCHAPSLLQLPPGNINTTQPLALGCHGARPIMRPAAKRSAVGGVWQAGSASANPLACPVCRLQSSEAPPSCSKCSGYFPRELARAAAGEGNSGSALIDLTPEAAGSTATGPACYSGFQTLRQEIFRTPLVSLAYERLLPALWSAGLRDTGIEDEKAAVLEFFSGTAGTAADISCGTGLMARALAASGGFDRVIALDYSENMLQEVFHGLRREGLQSVAPQVVRGDVSALPLVSGSCDAVYSGAAMHCWPDVELGVRNIHDALRPGGKLYATTFLRPFPDVIFRFFTLEELEGIMLQAGFVRSMFQVEGKGVYATIRATK